ncbi:PTS sugar transporter [Enterococcus sp. JM4C]|uniref:PRD domain-containing protein n=1 Tax=Candidatus Enterococcus huntleyi TaxID=1857217 RepID=UPI001379626B|nr:PRD domain-containing protein [Enterococcus sp. JM4C]KAF1297527.1 PTS sugar transporter [Enterococcus sp. JM4C]
MKVKKIINNNIAIIEKGGHESIIYAPGVAFRFKKGQRISEQDITKTYVLDSADRLEHFSYLLAKSDEKTIQLLNDLVTYGEKLLEREASDYLYLALLDHISFAWKRGEKGQFIRSPLSWEVKKFYPTYYEIGLYAIKKMQECYHIDFPEDEAVSIALHFVNIQEDKSFLNERIEDMETLRDILSIIKYNFNITFDESSINYMRLVTHLQYFIERLRNKRIYADEESVLFQQVKEIYLESYAVVQKIEIYVTEKFKQTLSQEEYTYLIVHINRVTERKENKDEV